MRKADNVRLIRAAFPFLARKRLEIISGPPHRYAGWGIADRKTRNMLYAPAPDPGTTQQAVVIQRPVWYSPPGL